MRARHYSPRERHHLASILGGLRATGSNCCNQAIRSLRPARAATPSMSEIAMFHQLLNRTVVFFCFTCLIPSRFKSGGSTVTVEQSFR